MGLLDHRKTWRYRLNGSPAECVDAFVAAFTGSGGVLVKARWGVSRSGRGAVATYQGRKGLASAMTILSRQASMEQEGAIGSKVTFEVESADAGETVCAMHLSTATTSFGVFINDGRFFRPYMRAVEGHLREVDPRVEVSKG